MEISIEARQTGAATLEHTSLAGAAVTVVDVPAPWYAHRWLLRRAFLRAIPEYLALPGLLRKHFTIGSQPAVFGGIYLWRSRAAAEAWFTDEWHARVRARYGQAGRVSYFAASGLAEQHTPPAVSAGYRVVVAVGPQVLLRPEGQAGLVRLIALEPGQAQLPGLVSLWQSAHAAQGYERALIVRPGVQVRAYASPVVIGGEQGRAS
jgi:hypothetical protein